MKFVCLMVLFSCACVSAQGPNYFLNFITRTLLGYGDQDDQTIAMSIPSWFQPSLPSWILPFFQTLLKTSSRATPLCNYFPSAAGLTNPIIQVLVPTLNSFMCSTTSMLIKLVHEIQFLLKLFVKICIEHASKDQDSTENAPEAQTTTEGVPVSSCPPKPLNPASLYASHLNEATFDGFCIQLYDRGATTFTMRPDNENIPTKFGLPTAMVTNVAGDRIYAVQNFPGSSANITIYGWEICLGKFNLLYSKVQPESVGVGGTRSLLAIDSTKRYLLQIDSKAGQVYVERIEPGDTLTRTHTEPVPTGCDKTDAVYPHITFHPTMNNVVAVSYGDCRKIVFYKFDSGDGKLSKLGSTGVEVDLQTDVSATDLVFSPNGMFMYVADAKGFRILVYSVQQTGGTITAVTLLPNSYKTKADSDTKTFDVIAELQMHPNGNFLYAINNEHNSIVVYKIDDPTNYELTLVDFSENFGEDTETMALAPDGSRLFVSFPKTKNIIVFGFGADGKLIKQSEMPNNYVITMLATNK